jgi:hypothetical protein
VLSPNQWAKELTAKVDYKTSISANSTADNVGMVPYVMNRNQSKEAGVKVSSAPVAPKVPRNHRGDDDAPNQCNREIMPVLPLHNGILTQVADVGRPRLDSRFHKHPHNMRLHFKMNDYK